MKCLLLAIVTTLGVIVGSSASEARADGSWIDGPRVNWNQVYGSWQKHGFENNVSIMESGFKVEQWKDIGNRLMLAERRLTADDHAGLSELLVWMNQGPSGS